MDTKTAKRLLAEQPTNSRIGEVRPARGDGDSYFTRNDKENAVIDAIDERRSIEKFLTLAEGLHSGRMDVNQALGKMAPDMVMNLFRLALEGSEKIKLAAIQDWLDRAGYGKVQKHAVAAVDASQSKEALISMLLGASKDLKSEGIEIIDDTGEDQ